MDNNNISDLNKIIKNLIEQNSHLIEQNNQLFEQNKHIQQEYDNKFKLLTLEIDNLKYKERPVPQVKTKNKNQLVIKLDEPELIERPILPPRTKNLLKIVNIKTIPTSRINKLIDKYELLQKPIPVPRTIKPIPAPRTIKPIPAPRTIKSKRVIITQIDNALEKNVKQYKISVVNTYSPLTELKTDIKPIINLLKNNLDELKGIKFNRGLEIKMVKYVNNDKNKDIIKSMEQIFWTNPVILTSEHNIEKVLNKTIDELTKRIHGFLSQGSGWQIQEIYYQYFDIHTYKPL